MTINYSTCWYKHPVWVGTAYKHLNEIKELPQQYFDILINRDNLSQLIIKKLLGLSVSIIFKIMKLFTLGSDHSFSTIAKFSEKLTFLTLLIKMLYLDHLRSDDLATQYLTYIAFVGTFFLYPFKTRKICSSSSLTCSNLPKIVIMHLLWLKSR